MKKLISKIPKTVKNKIDDLVIMIAKSFSSLGERMTRRIDGVDSSIATMVGKIRNVEKSIATKADILALYDQFIHRREFDYLSLRVNKLEEKTRR